MAVPAAVLAIASGAISLRDAADEALRMAPVIGFLAALLVLARLCSDEGLFRTCGHWMARLAGRRPRRLLAAVFAVASTITAVLSLDATVVLLTPVVSGTAKRLDVQPKPHVYACSHLSNSASLLLPVSNLTNLLAFAASGLTFTRFALLMALPWVVAIAAEYLVFGRFFAEDLRLVEGTAAAAAPAETPTLALIVLGLTLVGFGAVSALGLNPAWAALGGVVLLAVPALARRRTTPVTIGRAAAVPFLAFVLALAVVVRAVVNNGLGGVIAYALPHGDSLAAMLGIAFLAAVLANVINNLPATLVLLPLAAVSGPGAVLALLLGVNIGPNLTYTGSLATMLWRRTMRDHGLEVELGEFTRLGLLAVPATLVLAVLALWVALRVVGA